MAHAIRSSRSAFGIDEDGELHPTLTQRLEDLANRQPAAPAIHAPGRTTLTYADLGAQIRSVRERLGNWNVVP